MTKIIPTAKITVVKKENPFTEGSKVAKRVGAVLKAKTVEEALKKGARTSTVRYCVKHRLVKVAA